MSSQGNLQIRQYCLLKKNTLSKRAAPGPTSLVSIDVALSNKDEGFIGQLFMRSLKMTFSTTLPI